MPACFRNSRLSAGGAQAYGSTDFDELSRIELAEVRSVPDDDAEADDWEAIDPDPAELEEWDEPLADESFEDGCDKDDDDWDEAEDWHDFDQSEDDDED
ncbi:MAG TPA: hypothetical protein VHV55_08615 [Pirellulales bacterium]|jgi:hypothetical protein|nr:hypothetical protein [Pirellulales bacterium]